MMCCAAFDERITKYSDATCCLTMDLSEWSVEVVVDALYTIYTGAPDLPDTVDSRSQMSLVNGMNREERQCTSKNCLSSIPYRVELLALAQCLRIPALEMHANRHLNWTLESVRLGVDTYVAEQAYLTDIIHLVWSRVEPHTGLRGTLLSQLKYEEYSGGSKIDERVRASLGHIQEFIEDYNASILIDSRDGWRCNCSPRCVILGAFRQCTCGCTTKACTECVCCLERTNAFRCLHCSIPGQLRFIRRVSHQFWETVPAVYPSRWLEDTDAKEGSKPNRLCGSDRCSGGINHTTGSCRWSQAGSIPDMTIVVASHSLSVHKFVFLGTDAFVVHQEVCDAIRYHRRPVLDLSEEPIEDVVQMLHYAYNGSYILSRPRTTPDGQVDLCEGKQCLYNDFAPDDTSEVALHRFISCSVQRDIAMFRMGVKLGWSTLEQLARRRVLSAMSLGDAPWRLFSPLYEPSVMRFTDLEELPVIIAHIEAADNDDRDLYQALITRIKWDEHVSNQVPSHVLTKVASAKPEFLVDYATCALAPYDEQLFLCECGGREQQSPRFWAFPFRQCECADSRALGLCTSPSCLEENRRIFQCIRCYRKGHSDSVLGRTV
jgi:hypothetical protein